MVSPLAGHCTCQHLFEALWSSQPVSPPRISEPHSYAVDQERERDIWFINPVSHFGDSFPWQDGAYDQLNVVVVLQLHTAGWDEENDSIDGVR